MPRLPAAPTRSPVTLRGDYSRAAIDFRLPQNYDAYTADEQYGFISRLSAWINRAMDES